MKSQTKAGDDVVDNEADEEAQATGVNIASPIASGDVHIEMATDPTVSAVKGIYTATTGTSGDMPVHVMKAKAEEVGKQQDPAKATVRIAGATGNLAYKINGMYEATTEMSGDMPVYAKVGDDDMWLEYNAALTSWQVKATSGKGSDVGMAWGYVSAKRLPEECPTGKWLVYDGTKVGRQQTVTISVQHGNGDNDEEAKPKAAAMKVDTGLAVAQTAGVGSGTTSSAALGGVRIVGAMGPCAGRINGVYKATMELSGDMPVYVKMGDPDVWLEYRADGKHWQAKSTADKGTDDCMTYCVVPAKCLPEKCPVGQWKIRVNDKFVSLPAIVSSVVTQEEIGAYLAEVKIEAVRVVRGRHNVSITGATGTFAGDINGIYKPTPEFCDNATVYVKVRNPNMCLKYHASMKQWQVKTTSAKGTDASMASCVVPAKCLLEECPAGKWLVANGSKWGPQQTVTITVQHDNSDVVSADDVDDDEAKPKAAAMKVDSGAAAVQAAGVGLASVSSGAVRIVGATGSSAGIVNGMYEATTELSGGMPVYVKVGVGGMWLEYHAPSSQWQVTLTSNKGTNHASAFCPVPAKCLPEDCPAGQWLVVDCCKLVSQPAVNITVATQDEVGAYLVALQREAARVVKGSQHVRITGATGSNAGRINGMYRPTEELSHSATLYIKVDDGDICLVFDASLMTWTVMPYKKGSCGSLAYCAVPIKCLPEKCPSGKWLVAEGDKLVSQPAVTIKQKKRER